MGATARLHDLFQVKNIPGMLAAVFLAGCLLTGCQFASQDCVPKRQGAIDTKQLL